MSIYVIEYIYMTTGNKDTRVLTVPKREMRRRRWRTRVARGYNI